MFNKALHTSFVNAAAATGVFGEDLTQQARTQENQPNSTYCTNYSTMQKGIHGFQNFQDPLCVFKDVIY